MMLLLACSISKVTLYPTFGLWKRFIPASHELRQSYPGIFCRPNYWQTTIPNWQVPTSMIWFYFIKFQMIMDLDIHTTLLDLKLSSHVMQKILGFLCYLLWLSRRSLLMNMNTSSMGIRRGLSLAESYDSGNHRINK